jgi:hypothetical protein
VHILYFIRIVICIIIIKIWVLGTHNDPFWQRCLNLFSWYSSDDCSPFTSSNVQGANEAVIISITIVIFINSSHHSGGYKICYSHLEDIIIVYIVSACTGLSIYNMHIYALEVHCGVKLLFGIRIALYVGAYLYHQHMYILFKVLNNVYMYDIYLIQRTSEPTRPS